VIECSLVLRNLVIEFRYCELSQQFSGLDMISDVDVALGYVAGRARKDIGRGECGRRARQGDRNGAGARLDRRDAHAGYEITRPLGSRHHLLLLRNFSPHS